MIEIVDPVADYEELMASLFDFERIAALFESVFRIRYDGMSAITGPYARAILEQRLGAPPGSALNGELPRTSAAIIRTPTRHTPGS